MTSGPRARLPHGRLNLQLRFSPRWGRTRSPPRAFTRSLAGRLFPVCRSRDGVVTSFLQHPAPASFRARLIIFRARSPSQSCPGRRVLKAQPASRSRPGFHLVRRQRFREQRCQRSAASSPPRVSPGASGRDSLAGLPRARDSAWGQVKGGDVCSPQAFAWAPASRVACNAISGGGGDWAADGFGAPGAPL